MFSALVEIIRLQFIQITVLIGFAWLVTNTITRNQSHLSQLLWLVVLVKCITPPIWQSPTGVFCWLQFERQPQLSRDLAVPNPQPMIDVGDHPVEVPLLVLLATSTESELPPIITPDADVNSESLLPTETSLIDSLESSSINTVLGGERATWFPWAVVVAWLGFTVGMLSWAIVRTVQCLRGVLAHRVVNAELDAKTEELRHRLGVRRTVRLAVTNSRVGPGVIGLFRPLIVLPQFIVRQRSIDELEPILAHELIHIRRGDLWVGFFRHLTRALWWCHPLVWLMSSRVRHGAEKCCDEEVIASLGISPQCYARSLLSVLEAKQQLQALPVVPGVRPVDVTSSRLERIMNLGQECHESTPRWCWAVAILFAAICLPGAGLILGGQDEESPVGTEKSLSPTSVDSSEDIADSSTVPLTAGTSTLTTTKRCIPWNLLRRTPVTEHKLESGDMIGLYIEGILGGSETPSVNVPADKNTSPSVGTPVLIRSNGTISLPMIRPLNVAGMSLEEAEKKISDAFTIDKILNHGRVMLSLVRAKQVRVLVFRQDLRSNLGGTNDEDTVVDQHPTGFAVSLAADEADVLTVLAKTGGLPSRQATDEILIYAAKSPDNAIVVEPRRIPVTIPQGIIPRITDADVTLKDGDTVVVPHRNDGDVQPNQATKQAVQAEHQSAHQSEFQAETVSDVMSEPRATRQASNSQRWDLTLYEALGAAIQNSQAIRGLVQVATFQPTQGLPEAPMGFEMASQALGDVRTLMRTNNDIALADLEITVRDYILEVTRAYWNLYFYRHNLDAARTGLSSAHALFKSTKMHEDAASEAQARAQYFSFRSRFEQALSHVEQAESDLQYTMGIAATDERHIVPIDVPTKAKFLVDWDEIKSVTIEKSPELRRQRWRLKQCELQAIATRRQLLSQVDSTTLYRFLELGEHSTDTVEELQEWQLGTKFEFPLGLRAELTSLRNQQMHLKRTRKRLEETELEIVDQLSSALRKLRDEYQIAMRQYNTLLAFRDEVDATETAYEAGTVPFDLVLDSQSRRAQAEIDYFRALTEHQIAIAEIHSRKGTLLEASGFRLQPERSGLELEGEHRKKLTSSPLQSR